MLMSKAYRTTYKKKPAKLYVYRNNGVCWGRLEVGNEQFDVVTRKDWYDYPDEDAASAFIKNVERGRVEPAVGWT